MNFLKPTVSKITSSSKSLKLIHRTSGIRWLIPTLVLLAFLINSAEAKGSLSVETRSAKSGDKYSFVFINEAPVSLVDTEPDRNDSHKLLSIPIAFTSVTGKVVGVFVHDGSVERSPTKHLSGAVVISKNRFEIVDTISGASLTSEYLNNLAKTGGSLVQQFLIVRNGKACSFRDKGLAQRRGIGKLKDGKEVMIESKGFISLTQFASDLVDLGVHNCLYSDLGAWGQSWLRDPKTGKVIKLANEKSVTENHTNWFLVSAPQD